MCIKSSRILLYFRKKFITSFSNFPFAIVYFRHFCDGRMRRANSYIFTISLHTFPSRYNLTIIFPFRAFNSQLPRCLHSFLEYSTPRRPAQITSRDQPNLSLFTLDLNREEETPTASNTLQNPRTSVPTSPLIIFLSLV